MGRLKISPVIAEPVIGARDPFAQARYASLSIHTNENWLPSSKQVAAALADFGKNYERLE
jgi:hypothetical protein